MLLLQFKSKILPKGSNYLVRDLGLVIPIGEQNAADESCRDVAMLRLLLYVLQTFFKSGFGNGSELTANIFSQLAIVKVTEEVIFISAVFRENIHVISCLATCFSLIKSDFYNIF
ncbi:hypothetical protein NIES3974_02030 [Calothrix sp. NIES-3974]|nr:hypothetical protein NIES3974_02030 [Calothrix sp. NIES-3974]